MKTVFAALLLATTLAAAAERPEAVPWKRPERWEGKAAITYEGADGSSLEKAVVIKGAKNSEAGVRAEYDWAAKKFPGYRMKQQSLQAKDGKSYDVLAIVTKDGKAMEIHFDITDFFGKF